jgi:hypothetical protein
MATQQILAEADAALTAALDTTAERNARRDAMKLLMRTFETLAKDVDAGTASWDDAREWGRRNAERFCDARDALADWQAELAKLFDYGNEEEIEWALDRRSQHAFAREVFRDTEADELLATYETAEGDAELRERAELVKLEGPSYAPRTHTWWFWRS